MAASILRELIQQARRLRTFLLWIYLPTLILLVVTFLAAVANDVVLGDLTRDPINVLQNRLTNWQHNPEAAARMLQGYKVSLYVGFLSNVGATVWAIGLGMVFAAFFVQRKRRDPSPTPGFFLASTLVTGLLLLDDLFLLREVMLPWSLGIVDKLAFVPYAAAVAGYIILWRRTIRESDYLVLVLAIGLLVTSLLVDLAPGYFIGRMYIEDGLKLMGIVSWAAYMGRTAYRAMAEA